MKNLKKIDSEIKNKFILHSRKFENRPVISHKPKLTLDAKEKIRNEISNAQKVAEALSVEGDVGKKQNLKLALSFIKGLPNLKEQLKKIKGPYRNTPEINEFIVRIDLIINRLTIIYNFKK